jgi:hypothetical protein
MNPRAAWILIVAVALVALLMSFGWPRRPPIRSRFGAGVTGGGEVASPQVGRGLRIRMKPLPVANRTPR